MIRALRLRSLLVPVAAAAALACGPNIAEGTSRPARMDGRAGVVRMEGTEVFLDGEWRKHGAFTFRNENGDVTDEGRYANGLETGPWRQVYADGSVGRGSFFEGERVGPWDTFHPNGKAQDSGEYVAGMREGPWTSRRADGTLLREAVYEDGVLNGLVTWYLEDGRTVDATRSGVYEDGELTSTANR